MTPPGHASQPSNVAEEAHRHPSRTVPSASARSHGPLRSALTVASVAAILLGTAAGALAETYTVKMGSDRGLLEFQPKALTIKPGDTIIWVVNKMSPHSVVFDPVNNPTRDKALAASLSRTKLLTNPGQTAETVFPVDAPAGVYLFYSGTHRGAGMKGQVTVQP